MVETSFSSDHEWISNKLLLPQLVSSGKTSVITILLPKNKDLREFAEREFQRLVQAHWIPATSKLRVCYFRGEDIPFLTEKYSKRGHPVIGVTGEDLVREHMFKKPDSKLQIVEKVPWNNEKYLFRKPTLCLLGPKGKTLNDFKGVVRVTLNRKYFELSKCYLKQFESPERTFKEIYLSGETERTVGDGLADLCIEIVCTGSTVGAYGLEIYDKVFESNLVVIQRAPTKLAGQV